MYILFVSLSHAYSLCFFVTCILSSDCIIGCDQSTERRRTSRIEGSRVMAKATASLLEVPKSPTGIEARVQTESGIETEKGDNTDSRGPNPSVFAGSDREGSNVPNNRCLGVDPEKGIYINDMFKCNESEVLYYQACSY